MWGGGGDPLTDGWPMSLLSPSPAARCGPACSHGGRGGTRGGCGLGGVGGVGGVCGVGEPSPSAVGSMTGVQSYGRHDGAKCQCIAGGSGRIEYSTLIAG